MEKITEYGKIKLSDNVFEKAVKEGLALTNGRDSLAMERKSISVEEEEDGIRVEFHVVHKFGTSMLFSSMTVMNYIEENILPNVEIEEEYDLDDLLNGKVDLD